MNATGTTTPFSISAYKSNEAGPSPQLTVSSDKYAVSADKAMLFEVYEEAWTVGLLHCWSAKEIEKTSKLKTSYSLKITQACILIPLVICRWCYYCG